MKKDKEQLQKESKQKVIQSMINIRDIQSKILYTKDGYLMVYVGVLPVNISLLSKAEQKRKRDLLKEKLNIETDYEFIKVCKSADLSMQINYLQDLMKNEENYDKKMALAQNIRATSRYSQQGEMVNNQYYYIFRTQYIDNQSIKEIQDKLVDFVNKLEECEIKAYALSDIEIAELNNLFCNPTSYTESTDLDYYVTSFMD